MRKRRAAYREVFGADPDKMTPAQRTVWLDMAKFCYADYPTFDPDPRIHAMKEGRREWWLRVRQFVNLSDRQISAWRDQEDADE